MSPFPRLNISQSPIFLNSIDITSNFILFYSSNTISPLQHVFQTLLTLHFTAKTVSIKSILTFFSQNSNGYNCLLASSSFHSKKHLSWRSITQRAFLSDCEPRTCNLPICLDQRVAIHFLLLGYLLDAFVIWVLDGWSLCN